MKSNTRFVTVFILVSLILYLLAGRAKPAINTSAENSLSVSGFEADSLISFKAGDLLVRPNINGLPGSSEVASGRNFGHVLIVVRGAEGKNIEEVLHRTIVVEAILFDQKSRSFIFNLKNQVRMTEADVSFGKRFEGFRYRLRADFTENQQKIMSEFLYSQVGKKGYNIFAKKTNSGANPATNKASMFKEPDNWNCATLAWYAFKQAVGIDIDSNLGYSIYPNDIIRCESFNATEGRIRF